MRFLLLPAVPHIAVPSAVNMPAAAMPTPPAAACTSTELHAVTWLAWLSMMCDVMHTVGMDAASSCRRQGGLGATSCRRVPQRVPRHPGAKPNTLLPSSGDTAQEDGCVAGRRTTTPEQSPPGSPGSPGYMPRQLSTSRKLMPTACTSISRPSGGSVLSSAGARTRRDSEPRGDGVRRMGCCQVGAALGNSDALIGMPLRTTTP